MADNLTSSHDQGFWRQFPQLALERIKQLGQQPAAFAQDTMQRLRAGAQNAMAPAQAAAPLDPALRQGVPPEAMSAAQDPNDPEFARRQAIARALFGGGQPPPPPGPPMQ